MKACRQEGLTAEEGKLRGRLPGSRENEVDINEQMEKAFLKIVDEHQNIIHKLSRMYRDTKEDQEDLFQEVVYQLWKAFPAFRKEAKVSSWMYRIALNTAIASFRKKTVPMEFNSHIPEKLHPVEAVEESENEARMYEALRKLNSVEKAVISLYLEDFSYQEIAEITGISESYVGVRINRAKTKLKHLLK